MAAGHRRWRTIAQRIRLEQRPCHLCGQDIDYSLRWPHPMSFSADHILPSNHGGRDVYENCAAAHLTHNCARHDDPLPPLTEPHTETW